MKTVIDTEVTKVKFLIDTFARKDKANSKNRVFAYFPKDNFSTNGLYKTCYAHIGQHSACHPDYAKECKEATIEQYTDLKKELEGIGYKLEILNRK